MKRPATRPSRRRPVRNLRRLRLESLEDRRLLAVINVPGDQPSVQDAVNAANPNDEIVLANGTYTENVNLDTMASEGNITIRAANAGMATIDGGAGGSAISASTFSGNITIQGLNLDQDVGSSGGVLNFVDVSGTITVDGNTFDGFGEVGIFVQTTGTTSTTINIVNGNTFANADGNESAILFDPRGNSTFNFLVDGNTFTNLEDSSVDLDNGDNNDTGATQITGQISNNTFNPAADSGDSIDLILGQNSTMGVVATIVIDGNTMDDIDGKGIEIDIDGTGTIADVTITNNTISNLAADEGIFIDAENDSDGLTVNLTIDGNTITGTEESAIHIRPFDGNVGNTSVWDAVITNNTISNANTGNNTDQGGIWFDADDTDDDYELTVELSNNASTATFGPGYHLDQANGSTVNLKQGISGSLDPATVIADNNNSGSTLVTGTVNVLVAAQTEISLVGSTLRIEDIAAASDDTLTIQSDTANSQFIISDPGNLLTTSIPGSTGDGTNSVTIPFGSITAINVSTLGGDDSLTIDYSLGNFAVPLDYDGGTQNTVPGGDLLTLTGGSFPSITDHLTAPGAGGIDLNSDNTVDITYTGLEPVDQTGLVVADRTLNLAGQVWINEFHYDNTGTDTGEFIEVAGTAGVDLSGYSLALYNGATGLLYDTINLTGVIDDEGTGQGAVSFALPTDGIQNGPGDGIALVQGGTVVQFLSYEGTLIALDGPAAGLMSVDVGVEEDGSDPVGQSLQLTGSGASYADFTWNPPAAESPGSLNAGQTTTGIQAVLEDYLAANDGFSRFRGTNTNPAFEEIRFQNPANSLTIITPGGETLVQLDAMDDGFAPGSETFDGQVGDTFQLIASGVIADTTDVTVTTATLDLNGNSEAIDGLFGDGTVAALGGSATLTVNEGSFSGLLTDVAGNAGAQLSVTKESGGTLVLSNSANDHDGVMTLNDGVLEITTLSAGNTPSSLGAMFGVSANLIFDGGTLRYTGGSVSGVNRAFALQAGGGTIEVTNPAANVDWTDAAGAGPITGPGALTKDGPGTLTLQGNNNYTGGTTVSEGTLAVENNNSLGTGPVTLGDAASGAAAIRLIATHGASDLVINEPITVSGLATGTVTIGGEHTGGRAFFDGLITLNRDVTLRGAGNDRTQFRGGITGTGNVTIDGGNRVTWSTTTATAEAGDGAAPYDFDGDVTITGNTLLQTNSNFTSGASSLATKDFQIDGGSTLRLTYDTDVTIDELSGAGDVTALAASGFPDPSILTIGADNGSSTFTGQLRDDGRVLALTKSGSGTIRLAGGTGNNTHTGLTLVSDGILEVGGAFGGDGAIGGNITVENGATYRMLQDNVIINSSDITVNVGGTLDMNGRTDAIGNLNGGGDVINNSHVSGIYLDDLNATHTFSGNITGGGGFHVRGLSAATGTQVLSGGTFAFGRFRIGRGAVTITGGATVSATSDTLVGTNRGDQIGSIPNSSMTGTLNVESGSLTTRHIEMGNRAANTVMGFINQTGGAVSTTGNGGDNAGVRIGHWPAGFGTYNLVDGTLTVGDNRDLSTAIDGVGVFHQTGGVANAQRINVNSRNNTNGNGTVTLDGGVFNLGGGGIVKDNPSAPATVNLGGGTLRATASFSSVLDMNLTNATGPAVIDTNGNSVALSGSLSGPGGLHKIGLGTLSLNGGNTYTGTTDVDAGTLLVNGSTAATSAVDLTLGATLGGEGNANGNVTLGGGTIAPGTSPGVLTTGSVDMTAGGSFDVEIDGDDAGNGAGFHDQLVVNGTVDLGAGATTLSLSGLYVPAAGDDFVILANDGAEDTTGFFTGLPEGSELTFNGQTLYLTYNGGDGNDVVLNTGPVVSGTSGNDTLEVTPLPGGDLRYQFLPGGPVVTLTGPLSSFTFNGRGGDDVMIVQANGNAFPAGGLFFNGGGQDFTNPPTPAGGDLLQVFGSGQDATYTPSATTTGDGVVDVSGAGTITFTGLEPVDMSGLGTVTVPLPGANDVLAIDNGFDALTGTTPALVVSGTTGGVPIEALHAWNNTTLVVDTSVNDGTDSVIINSADNAHGNTNLEVVTGPAGLDVVTVAGAATVAGYIELDSRTIQVNAPLTAGTLVDLDARLNIATAGGAVDVVAPLLEADANGSIDLDTNVDTIDAAGNGVVTLDELNAVTLLDVTSNNNPIQITAGGTVTAENVDAGNSTVGIAVTGGGIVSGGADPGTADIVGSTIGLTLNTSGTTLGTGAADRLEIDGDLLMISNPGSLNLNYFVVDTAGGLTVDNSSTGGGGVTVFDLLVENGNLTGVPGGGGDVRADIVIVEVTGAGSTIGSNAANPLEINAVVRLDATSAGGDIFVEDVTTDLPVGLVNANGGNVYLEVRSGDLLSAPGDAGVADVLGNVVELRLGASGNTIGVSAGNRFELDANVLRVQAPNSSAFLVDTANGVALRDSTVFGGGNTYDLLAVNGGIVSEVVDGNRDVGAGILILETTGIGSIGTGVANPLEINATTRFDATTANQNIFAFDPDAPLPLGLVDAGTANVDLRATGDMTDANGAANNLTAGGASLRATAGIGSGNALETSISTLAASNLGPGNIEIVNNVSGLLTIGSVNGFSGITNTGGNVVVTNLSPLAVAANVTAAGSVTLNATDSAAAGDDLTVNGGVTVQSTGSSVTLNAGDDALINGDLTAATTVTVNGDFGNADAGTGSTVTINGTVTTGGGAFLNGEVDDDVFNLSMQTTSSFTIDGQAPSFGMGVPPAVGDTLNLSFAGATDPTLTVDGATPGSGTFTTSSAEQPVVFTDIEQFDTSDPYHLVVDRSAVGADGDVIDAQVNSGDLEIRVNGGLVLSTPQADILSLTLIGSNNDETFSITETADGLPSFLTAPPSFVPGSNGAHLNATASLRLTAALGAAPTPNDVTIHIDGGSGDTDDLLVTLISGHDVLYASDTLDTANSGNVGIVSPPLAGPPQNLDLLLSFADLEPITFVGAGGGLLLDASSTPATANLTLSDAGAAGDGVSIVTGDGGFEDTTFSGFNALSVVGGTGSETMTLAGADPAASNGAALSQILLIADNATNNDTADDTINVWSLPATIVATLQSGAGDDSFNLFNPGSTVDNIAGLVLLDGQAGNDSLTVLDTGDLTGDNVLINETTIEGMTGFAGTPDVSYQGIEQLDVTTSSGNDLVTADFTTGGSSLINVTIHGAAGDDTINVRDDANLGEPVVGLATLTVNGNAGSDTFNEPTGPPNPNPNTDPRGKLLPSLTTRIFVNGESGPTGSGNPTSPPNGDTDTFNLDVTPLTAPVIVDTIAGIATSAGPHQNVNFSGMEDLCLDDVTRDDVNINIGELYVRTTDNRERIVYTLWNDGGVKLRIDDLDAGTSTFFPEHFGLAGGVQRLQRIVTFAQDGNDLVSIAGHVVDGNNDPIPVEFHGEDGDDYLTGANGDDILVGGPGSDRVLGGEGNNLLFGDGNVLDAFGIPIELPTDGDDNVSGRSGNDTIFGGGGGDRLYGDGGDDYLHAGSGNDLVDGGLQDDVLVGADGNDTLSGNYGDDILLGGLGDDRVYGRAGYDVLLGGSDRDIVRGSYDDDLVVGGNASNVDDSTSDAALRAILADWVSNPMALPAGLGTLQLDGVQDLLLGDLGADAFHSDQEDRIYDFRASNGDWLL